MTRLLLLLCAIFIIGASPAPMYAEGQVWSYKTRLGEEASLLKIQMIETTQAGRVFHISVVGFRLRNPRIAPILPHAPVSQQTLDASVISLRTDPGNFPSVETVKQGIDEWRSAHGGVFAIPVAQVIQVMDETTSQPQTSQP